MRVVALFRVSTERQAEHGASLDAQEREYDQLAARSGWVTVGRFRGTESATQASSDRRVLQQVLGCLRERQVDAVYVHEQSRLTRGDQLEVAMLMRELQEGRVKIIVHGVVRDMSSLDERFMVNIQSVVDRAESERIKERMTRGKAEKARQGKKTSGSAPYGYANPAPGQHGRGTLVIVPERAAVVRRIFALAASGLGCLRVARELNRLGIPGPRGGGWVKNTVRNVLDNPAYIGTSAANVWVPRAGRRSCRLDLMNPEAIIRANAHEALIERAVWDQVHSRPVLPRTLAPRMLTGMLWVGGVRYSGDGTASRPYYRRQGRVNGSPWLEMQPTDEAVWDAFASLATSPEFVAGLMREAVGAKEQELLRLDIEHLEGQAEKLRRRLERLTDMRADGEIAKDAFLAKSHATREAISGALSELAELKAKAVLLDGSHAVRVVRAVQVLLEGRTRLTGQQKRAALRSIVRRIDVTPARNVQEPGRDAAGRFRDSPGRLWTVGTVSFRLTIPVENAHPGEPDRVGHLVTKP